MSDHVEKTVNDVFNYFVLSMSSNILSFFYAVKVLIILTTDFYKICFLFIFLTIGEKFNCFMGKNFNYNFLKIDSIGRKPKLIRDIILLL